MKRLKMKRQMSRCWIALVAGMVAGGLWAETLVWTGGGDGSSWSDAKNWNVTPDWSAGFSQPGEIFLSMSPCLPIMIPL